MHYLVLVSEFIGATAWSFLVLGFHEVYFKEWAIKFTKAYTKPFLTLNEKETILRELDTSLIEGFPFADSMNQAITSVKTIHDATEKAKAVKEIADLFDIEVLSNKMREVK